MSCFQVQKFALRFLSVDEAQRFMNSLKVKPLLQIAYSVLFEYRFHKEKRKNVQCSLPCYHHRRLKPLSCNSEWCKDWFVFQEIFNIGRDIEPLNIDLGSEISAESEFMSSNIPLSR